MAWKATLRLPIDAQNAVAPGQVLQGVTELSKDWYLFCGFAALSVAATAAPLDVFLTARLESASPNGYLEIGSDQMNGSLDVFHVRDSDPLTAGTKAGDYHGTYISGGVPLGDGKWLSGGLWQRALSSTSDTYNYTSWMLSGLYRFVEADGKQPAIAVRLSGWGSGATATESTTAVVVPGARLNTVKITDPSDRQLQVDLIGTWNLNASSDVSVNVGVGSSQLSYSALTATTTRNGCDYNVTFTGNNIYGTLIPPCNVSGGVIQQFYDSSGDYGVDVAKEIAWSGTFFQAGVNGRWQNGPWTIMAGYLLHVVKREAVDDILAARGRKTYTQNHNISLQTNYQLNPKLTMFARGQLTSNLFFNDIPVTYNTSTAERFDSKYSLFTVGMQLNF